jgi:hypothetical protein
MSFLILWQVLAAGHTNVATGPSRLSPVRDVSWAAIARHTEMGAFFTEIRVNGGRFQSVLGVCTESLDT